MDTFESERNANPTGYWSNMYELGYPQNEIRSIKVGFNKCLYIKEQLVHQEFSNQRWNEAQRCVVPGPFI